MSKTVSRSVAIAAYLAAQASPAAADWRAVADQLYGCLPATRASVASSVSVDGIPSWWADYRLPKVYSLDSLEVTFADGVRVRCNLAQAPRKPARIAAACRVAIGFYRARTGRASVPAFAHLENLSDGSEFDAAACSRLTADLRSVSFGDAPARPAVTAEAVARMAAEVERRRAGLARAATDLRTVRTVHARLSADQRIVRGREISEAESREAMWRAAVDGGEAELERMRAALPASGLAPAVPEAVAAPLEAEAPLAAPVAPSPAPAPLEPACADPEADAAAAWCEAVAPLYGEPAPYAIGETLEPGAPLPARPAAPGAGPAPLPPSPAAPAALPAAEPEADPAEAVAAASPMPPLEGMAGPASAPLEEIGEPVADAWQPTADSHPVIALCLSPKAQAALFARVQDGTFPAADRTAKGGAWRLTVADARDCEGIPSVRLIGLPRKPYTRRAASPVEAIRAPLEAIRVPAAPAGLGYPVAGMADRAIVYHTPA